MKSFQDIRQNHPATKLCQKYESHIAHFVITVLSCALPCKAIFQLRTGAFFIIESNHTYEMKLGNFFKHQNYIYIFVFHSYNIHSQTYFDF